jgi:hypothetical protein
LRVRYERDTNDVFSVVLGATSLEDAVSRLDELERSADLNRQAIEQSSSARRELAALAERLRTIEQESRRRLERSNHSDETVALAVLMLFEAAEKAAAGRGPSSRSRYKAQRSRSRGPTPTAR